MKSSQPQSRGRRVVQAKGQKGMGTLSMRLAHLICSEKAKVAEVCVRGTVPIGELGDGGRVSSRKACPWLGLGMKESPVAFLFYFILIMM